MGTAISSTINNTKQKQNASFAQTIKETCNSSCVAIQSGNSVTLIDSNTSGITFDNSCTATGSCMMTAAANQITNAVQQAVQNGTASPSLFPGLQISSSINNTNAEINTAVTQILEAQCNATTFAQQTDNIVYAKNSTTGQISFSNSGSSIANCIEQFTVDATANLNQSSNQTATTKSGISFTTILIIIAIIFFVIVLLGVITTAFKSRKKDPLDCNDPKANPKNCTRSMPLQYNTAAIRSNIPTTISRARPIPV